MKTRYNSIKKILNAVTDNPEFVANGFTRNDLIRVTGMPKPTVYRTMAYIEKNFFFLFNGVGRSPKIFNERRKIRSFLKWLRNRNPDRTYTTLWKEVENWGNEGRMTIQTKILDFSS